MSDPIRIKRSDPPVEATTVPWFIIEEEDGSETVYTVPERISAATALSALAVFADKGQVAGVWYMISQSVTEETLAALYECPQVDHATATALIDGLGERYFGQLQEIVGKSGRR